jgi:hypothetical protein
MDTSNVILMARNSIKYDWIQAVYDDIKEDLPYDTPGPREKL